MDLRIYVFSDSFGITASTLVKAVMEQFPERKYVIIKKTGIRTRAQIDTALENINKDDIIFSTLVIKDLQEYLLDKCEERKIKNFPLLKDKIAYLEDRLDVKSKEKPGLNRKLDQEYFDTIAAMEFTISHDDGVNPKGILEADIVLTGVSRTSKTPTSLLLATRGYKVMNVPLVPGLAVPDEIYQVDKRRIIGLVISADRLNSIRRKRLDELGLNTMSEYAQKDRIMKELLFAFDVMDSLDCSVLDVTGKSINETANVIEEIIKKNFKGV